MTEEILIPIIESYINQSLGELEKENPKLDFKREWYNLTEELKINEFLKDTTAMANTVGLDGFIVIGFDDNDKTYHDAKFSQCGLKDTSQLNGIINRRVDRMFTISNFDININGHNLSILHIPPSFDKPHVIRNYKKNNKEEQHRIFVRKGSEVKLATKYDYDFMNYDKKNLVPEYRIHVSANFYSYSTKNTKIRDIPLIQLSGSLNIENSGQRPIAIVNINLIFKIIQGIEYRFISVTNNEKQDKQNILSSSLIIQSGEIQKFDNISYILQLNNKISARLTSNFVDTDIKTAKKVEAVIYLSTGKILRTQVEIIDVEIVD